MHFSFIEGKKGRKIPGILPLFKLDDKAKRWRKVKVVYIVNKCGEKIDYLILLL
jgi:hypothetical protein